MKFSILFLFVFVCLSSYAQFNKGDKYMGGSLSASTYSYSTPGVAGNSSSNSNNGWGLSPTVGFFLNGKTAFGFTLGYSYSTSENKSTNFTTVNTSKSLNSSIFLKQFITINDNFYFTLTESIKFSRSASSSVATAPPSTSSSESDGYSVGLGVSPSFIFFPSPNWGLEAGFGGLGYNYTRTLPNEGDSNGLGLSLSSSLSFGINYYFRKGE